MEKQSNQHLLKRLLEFPCQPNNQSRTTIIGMLAGMLGRSRDSYYEEFASDHIRIGIRVMRPIKKTFHQVNLLSIKEWHSLRR